jgi:hypothetical protein
MVWTYTKMPSTGTIESEFWRGSTVREKKRVILRAVPAYISYKTFSNFIDTLHRVAPMPNRIDRSVMGSLSGSNQSHLLAALRYLGLISPTRTPTRELTELVKANNEDHKIILRRVLTGSYPFLFEGFDLRGATIQEIEERFARAGASGDTLRKCVAFFLSAAKIAGIQTSPFASAKRRPRRTAGAALKSGYSSRAEDQGGHSVAPGRSPKTIMPGLPEFDPTWPNEIKAMWFEAYQELIKRSG